MILARLMVITDRSRMRPSFSQALNAAVLGGARLFQLREKGLTSNKLLELAQTTHEICAHSNAHFLINSDIEIARKANAFGAHLRESQSFYATRKLFEHKYSLGQSVHSLAAALKAQKSGADYLVFGSVFPTASHAGRPPVGLEALREVTREISIPVFAVGGISLENARECLEAGAHGVAVIRAIWDAPDVELAVRQFNEILSQ